MPLPDRYAGEVPEITKIWEPGGYFNAQTRIWEAQSEARHELYGKPSANELQQIRGSLVLTPSEIVDLNKASGHETNKLLRLVQGKLPSEIGNYIHRGNTSSDVLDTSLALQIKESLQIAQVEFEGLGESLGKLALQHRQTLQIGRSHTQQAIPQTFGRQVVGWYAEVMRGSERIDRAREVISYGKLSGEIGTSVFIDPELEERTLEKLGLKPDPAPTQVISRDRHAEVVALMAINAGTLSRIGTNIRLLAMTEVGEVREPFEKEAQQGSSAMPHKRNTELTERIVGLSRVVRGAALGELDSAILWLERDISHSSTERYSFPDTFGNLVYATKLTKKVIDGLEVSPERMLENLNRTYGAIYSSRLLNALLDTSAYSRTAGYEIVKELAQDAMDNKIQLADLASKDPRITKHIAKKDVAELFDPQFYMRNIDVAYKRTGLLKK